MRLLSRRIIGLLAILCLWWALPYTPDEVPAQSASVSAIVRSTTIQASGAQTGSGASTVTGNLTQIPNQCVNVPGIIQVPVTAGSGTVSTFKVWLQGTIDGTNFFPIPCTLTTNVVGTTFANTYLVANDSVVQTSGVAVGLCTIPVHNLRAAWIVNGTSPSETFSVSFACVG